jgi:16S rRNA (guanine527-N7)-methyltransferase
LDLSDETIERSLRPFGVTVDPELVDRIRKYISTLLFWNSKIALTTVTDPEEILQIHFGESFFLAGVAGIGKGRVADIGSGPGFPGIPIRMVRATVDLTIIEPVAKKTAFLAEIVRKIGISGVNIIRCRMEEAPAIASNFDFVTARALGKYDELLHWARPRMSDVGRMALLLGSDEVTALVRLGGWKWQEPTHVPESRSRFVFVGEPQKP